MLPRGIASDAVSLVEASQQDFRPGGRLLSPWSVTEHLLEANHDLR